MKLTAARLVADGLTLARNLTLLWPSAIDARFAAQRAVVALPADREVGWLRFRSPKSVGYIWVGADGEGRYQREAPADVAVDALPEIAVDAAFQPSLFLLDEFLQLLAGIAADAPLRIAGDDEAIESMVASDERATLAALAERLMATRVVCIDSDHGRRINAVAMQRIRAELLASIPMRPSPDALLALTGAVAADGEARRNAMAADAPLAAWCRGYDALCRAWVAARRERGDDEAAIVVGLARYVAFGCGGGLTDPDALLPALAEKFARDGDVAVVANVAEQTLECGEAQIETALAAASLDDFGAALYRAGLDLFTARRCYDALTLRPVSTTTQLSQYRKAADVAEEKCVRVADGLFAQLQNRTGEQWERHRYRVTQAREKGGDAAAEAQVFELIEMRYCWPRFMRPRLLAPD